MSEDINKVKELLGKFMDVCTVCWIVVQFDIDGLFRGLVCDQAPQRTWYTIWIGEHGQYAFVRTTSSHGNSSERSEVGICASS